MLTTILTVVEIGYVVLLASWIVLQKRSPVATLAWVLGLAVLPLFGFVLYFFLGPRRVRRNRLRRVRARLGLRQQEVLKLSEAPHEAKRDGRARQLMALGTRASGMPPTTSKSVKLLRDGAACYAAIVEAIRGAKHHVHLEYYIFEPDESGKQIRDALIERAKAGVEVRLLCDAVGSPWIDGKFLAPLREAGALCAFFHRVRWARLRPRLMNFRTHRKIVVVDGKIGFTGGINVTDTQNEAVNPRAFRDTHVRLEGAVVRWLQLVFLEDWGYATGHSKTAAEYFPPAELGESTREEECVQIVASGPDEDLEAIKHLYFAAIALAEKRVWITTPYLVPDEAMLTAMLTAAMRGVDVRVMVPRRSDSRLVNAATHSYFDDLVRAGVSVFEYTPRMVHAKTMVVDELLSAVGTANMDNRSYRLNFEVSAIVYGASFANELGAMFEDDLKSARGVNGGSLAHIALPRRLVEAVARVFSPLL